MEETLAQHTWFCGERMTAADIQMSFALEAAEARSDLTQSYPHCAAFLERIRSRPAYRAALDRGGHYELLGA
jgi:glutathione S-transferase